MKGTLEIERLILGALLAFEEPTRALDAAGLTVDEFSDQAMRVAFDFARRRAERNMPAHAIEVWGTAMKVGKLQPDDLNWLQTLQAGNSLDEKSFLRLAEDLRSQVRSRKLANRLRELAGEVDRQLTPLSTVGAHLDGMAQQLARSYQANRTAENDPPEVIEAWEKRASEGKRLQVSTGISLLDTETGGYVPNLNLLVGSPGVGKSALMASGIEGQLKQGMRVGVFGLEDGHAWITRRLLALRLGMKVRDVGSVQMDAAGWVRAGDVGAELSGLLKNMLVYKWGGINAHELVRWAVSWIVNEGVECIYVDNATEVNHNTGRPGDRQFDFRVQVAASVGAIRNAAERYGVPFVVLAHTKREFQEKNPHRPPTQTDVAEGAAFERRARFFLGIWEKKWDTELRATIDKLTEGKAFQTFAFPRHVEQGLVDVEAGRLVDLREEARKERHERKTQKIEEQTEDSIFKADLKKRKLEKLKAAPAAEEAKVTKPELAPQLELLAGVKVENSPPEIRTPPEADPVLIAPGAIAHCEACSGTGVLGMTSTPCDVCHGTGQGGPIH